MLAAIETDTCSRDSLPLRLLSAKVSLTSTIPVSRSGVCQTAATSRRCAAVSSSMFETRYRNHTRSIRLSPMFNAKEGSVNYISICMRLCSTPLDATQS